MLNNIVGKKIELLPKIPKEHEILCPTCGGIGWLEDGKGYIITCNNPLCRGGIIKCCPECGEPYKTQYYPRCNNKECKEKERIKKEKDEAEREKSRFEKAKKIKYEEAPNEIKEMVYSDYYDYNEGYSCDLEWIEDLELDDRPEYVWATHKETMHINAEDILENVCSDLHENAYDNLTDINQLQEFLDKWCEKQTGTDTYWVDYKITLLI